MNQTKAPLLTPSPTPEVKTEPHTQVFTGLVLDMSWRLALVVLIPIVGGFKLDEALHTSPALVILGFLLAMGGTGLVMRRMLLVASQLPVPKREERP